MQKTVLQPEGVHSLFSTYSHGIVVEGAGRIVFCAGQVAGVADGNIFTTAKTTPRGQRLEV